jgi:hypothetical protein
MRVVRKQRSVRPWRSGLPQRALRRAGWWTINVDVELDKPWLTARRVKTA